MERSILLQDLKRINQMEKITNTLLNVYKSILVGLIGIVGFFIVDIHRMVKDSHDLLIVHDQKIQQLEFNCAEIKEQNKGFELLFRKLLATLPNNDFDVRPKSKENTTE